MQYILPIVVALFPYLHNTSYPVELQSCALNKIIVQTQGQAMEVNLFNLKMNDEENGWAKTCTILENANEITMEIDASSTIGDPLSVYLFADTVLLQEVLVRDGLAYTLIHNPEYTYEKKLMEVSKSDMVMANGEDVSTSYPNYGWIFLLCIFSIWSFCIAFLLYKYKKFITKNTRQKE